MRNRARHLATRLPILALLVSFGMLACDFEGQEFERETEEAIGEVERQGGELGEEIERGAGELEQEAEAQGERVQQRVRESVGPEDEAAEAVELVTDATGTIRQMKSDPVLWDLARQSRGIFILPSFGQAAAGAGVRAGEGVLVANVDGEWSDPAFYDVGGVSFGAQLGASGGEIAMILLTEEALQAFEERTDFSLNADAGFVLVDYSALAQGRAGDEDVVLWSDTEGAFAGLALSVTGIGFDEEEAQAYYGQQVMPREIIRGEVSSSHGAMLESELN